jgi:hypothetical protein
MRFECCDLETQFESQKIEHYLLNINGNNIKNNQLNF